MPIQGERAFALLKSLAYERLSGSEAEERAANALLEEAVAAGGENAHIEEFTVQDAEVSRTEFEVTAPYRKSYPAEAFLRSAATEGETGREYDFLYGEDLLPANLLDAKGKAVLANGYLRYPGYEKLRGAGAALVAHVTT